MILRMMIAVPLVVVLCKTMILCMMIAVPLVVVLCNNYDSVYDDCSSTGCSSV